MIRAPFGTAGEVRVESLSGEFSHFAQLKSVSVRLRNEERVFEVQQVRFSNRIVLMRLSGIDGRESAARLTGAEVVVPRSQACFLEDGEFYYADLVGLTVMTGEKSIGLVNAVVESASRPLLEVAMPDGKPVLVPFHSAFVGAIDLDAGTVEIVNEELFS